MQFTNEAIKMNAVYVGDYTYGIPQIHIWGDKYKIYVGKFCSFAEGVKIIQNADHRTDWVSTYPFSSIFGPKLNLGHPRAKGDIKIGNDVWFGMNSTVLSGVKIGDGAVIGAGSVVTKDVEDYEIVAGNPAKHIRYRFSERQICSLKKIAWWNWSIEKIKEFAPLLESQDIDTFIKKANGERGLLQKARDLISSSF